MSIGSIVKKASDFLKQNAEKSFSQVKGPLDKLENNDYATKALLKFPNTVGKSQNSEYPHYAKFSIYAQASSSYLESKFSAAPASDIAADSSLVSVQSDTANRPSQTDSVVGIEQKQIRQTRLLKQQIYLYIPDTIQEKSSHNFDTTSITEVLRNYGLLGAVGGDLKDRIKNLWQTGSTNGPNSNETTGAATTEALSKAAEGLGFGNVTNLVQLMEQNKVVNPQFEIIYNSTTNREFLFDFRFIPRSQEEAKEILQIITAFKIYSSPELPDNTKGRYIIPPYEFSVDFNFGADRNTALHRIGNCVLTNIDVNYSTLGQFATFVDGMPIEIAMQLTFKETFILTKDLVEKGY